MGLIARDQRAFPVARNWNRFAKKVHMTLVVTHRERSFVDRNTSGAHHVTRPQRPPRSDIEAGNPPLEGRRAEIVTRQNRHARHVSDPFDFVGSARNRDRRLPALRARIGSHRQHSSAR